MVRCSKSFKLEIHKISNELWNHTCETGEMRQLEHTLNMPIVQVRKLRLDGGAEQGILPSPQSRKVADRGVNTGSLRPQAPNFQLACQATIPAIHPRSHSFTHPYMSPSSHQMEHHLMDTVAIHIGPVDRVADNVNYKLLFIALQVLTVPTDCYVTIQKRVLGKSVCWAPRTDLANRKKQVKGEHVCG